MNTSLRLMIGCWVCGLGLGLLTGCTAPSAGRTGQAERPEFTLEIPENPTTGFTWAYTLTPPGILEETADAFVPADASLCGAPGIRRISFRALRDTGDIVAHFALARPWETNTPPAETATYRLRVQNGVIRLTPP